MKKSALVFLIVFTALQDVQSQVKIGSAGNPNSNAVLELDGGTSKGLLMPRLNNTQITALTAAPDGLTIYNTTDGFLYLRKSGAWQKISDATNAGGLSLPYSGNSSAPGAAFGITSSADAIRGFGDLGNGVSGFSNSGYGGYFASGSGAALITSNGDVGINTTSPSFPLDINGRVRLRSNGSNNSAGIWFNKTYAVNTQSSFIGTFNDSTFGIYGGNSWKFFFDHINNNFGINNSDPKAPLSFSNATGNKLDIYYGSANSRYGIGLQAALMQLYSATANDDIAIGYGSSTAFTENMRVKGNGNVGIGTSNPGAKLDIKQNSSSSALSVIQAGTGFSMYAQNSAANSTIIAANLGVGPAITTYGNVGINNTDPAYNLDVAGRMRLRNESAGVTAGIWLDGPTKAERGFIGVYSNSKMGFYGTGETTIGTPDPHWGLLYDIVYGNIGINTVNANSKLTVNGSIATKYTLLQGSGTLNLNYTALNTFDNGEQSNFSFHYISPTGKGELYELQLPDPSYCEGRIYAISAEIQFTSGVQTSGNINGPDAPSCLLVTCQFKNVLEYPNTSSLGTLNRFSGLINYGANGGGSLVFHKRTSATVQSMFNPLTGTYFWAVIGSDFWDQSF